MSHAIIITNKFKKCNYKKILIVVIDVKINYNFFDSNDQRIFKHIFFVNKLWCRGNIKSKISDKQT